MAAIIECVAITGSVLYATIHDSSGQLWNGSAFEVFSSGNWSNYVNPLTEQTATGYYKASFPSGIASGKYTLVFYSGTGVVGDTVFGSGQIYWNGTIEEQGVGAVLVANKLDKLVLNTAGGTPPTVGSYLDQIFNADSGQSFSQATASLQALHNSAGGGPTAVQIANQVWDTVLPGAHTVAQSSSILLQAIYNLLPTSGLISNFNPASQTVNLGASQTGVTIGTVNALGPTAQANVATAVQALLNATAMPELTTVPGATPTIYQALMLAYMALRNQHTATSGQEKINNNGGSTIATATLTDDGVTFTKSQFT